MKLRKTLIQLSTVVAAFALTIGGTSGCKDQPAPTAKPIRLAFVTNNASEFWKIAAAGVAKYQKEAKVQVDVKMPSDGKTPAEQNQIIETLLSQGYDGIAVSIIAPNDQIDVINKAAAKTNFITFDSDSPKSNRLLYIGTNNYEAGKALGEQIVKLLPDGGQMAVFVGTFSADNAAQRLKGIEDAIKGKKIEIVEKKEDNVDHGKARSNVEEILNGRPDVDLVCGLWSYNGPAIAAALEASGKKGTVLAAVFDEEAGTLKGIADGTIACTVVQKPFEFGYQSSKWLHELATKGEEAKKAIPTNKIVDTGVEVINKGNVADFEKKLAEMKK